MHPAGNRLDRPPQLAIRRGVTVTPTFNHRVRLIQTRWRLVNQPLRLTIQAAAAGAAGSAIFTALQASHSINTATASVIVAVVFGTVTILQQRSTQRQKYTVDLISAFQTAEKLAAADTWMANRIADNEAVTADISETDEPLVMALLDYYEFLAILSEQGVVDVPIIRSLRGGTMARCFRLCKPYIEDRRNRTGPEIYRALERFTTTARLPAVKPPPDTAQGEDRVVPAI